MIAKFKNRVDFAGIVNYAHDHKNDDKRARIIGHQGVCIVSNETITDSFNTHLRRPDSNGKVHHLSQPVKHISIAFSPKDTPRFPDNEAGDRFMAQLVEEWLHGMGIDNAQYIVARHFDKKHPHCHLVFSRIDLNGNVISSFNELVRNAKVCREIKQKYGLTFGNSVGHVVSRDRLRPVNQCRFDIKTAVLNAAEDSSSWGDFQEKLSAEGIEASFSFNRVTGKIRGISFAKDGLRFAGSKLCKQRLIYARLAERFGEISVPVERNGSKLSAQSPLFSNDFDDRQTSGYTSEMDFHSENNTEENSISLIPLGVVINMLVGPSTVVQSSGGGGTSNDLDWNDERKRAREAQNNYFKTSKRKR